MERWKGTSIGKISLKKENKVGGITLPYIINYIATIIKTV